MAINLEAMRAKLNASKNGTSTNKKNDFKWRPSEGDQTIRVLPTEDGDPFKQFHFHYNVEETPAFTAPRRMMEMIAQSVNSHLNFGVMALKMMMDNLSKKQRSCLFESVFIHQFLFVVKRLRV